MERRRMLVLAPVVAVAVAGCVAGGPGPSETAYGTPWTVPAVSEPTVDTFPLVCEQAPDPVVAWVDGEMGAGQPAAPGAVVVKVGQGLAAGEQWWVVAWKGTLASSGTDWPWLTSYLTNALSAEQPSGEQWISIGGRWWGAPGTITGWPEAAGWAGDRLARGMAAQEKAFSCVEAGTPLESAGSNPVSTSPLACTQAPTEVVDWVRAHSLYADRTPDVVMVDVGEGNQPGSDWWVVAAHGSFSEGSLPEDMTWLTDAPSTTGEPVYIAIKFGWDYVSWAGERLARGHEAEGLALSCLGSG